MGIEEERICKLGLAIWRNGCCDAVENSIIGPRNNLDCGRVLGGSWRDRLDFLARYCGGRSGRFAISVALSFCHVVVNWEVLVTLEKSYGILDLLKLFLQGLLASCILA